MVIIAGDNSRGKSTILRCIAMGLCDKDSASALFREPGGGGDFVREKENQGYIKLWFTGKETFVETRIKNDSTAEFEVLTQTTSPKHFPWNKIFVCGYGAKWGEGSYSYETYMAVDAVYSLFNYDSPLLDAELVLRRLIGFKEDKKTEICGWLDNVLMLKPGSVKLDKELTVDGEWGEKMPVGFLGDGHQRTLDWLLDFLGWAQLAGLAQYKKNVHGIVLIDELEKHLHPKWQRQIVKLLHELFPNVQFIATTQSPLCLAGLADLPSEIVAVINLKTAYDGSIICENEDAPLGDSYEVLLDSDVFDYTPPRPKSTQDIIDQIHNLASQTKQSPEVELEIKKLINLLRRKAPRFTEDMRRANDVLKLAKAIEELESSTKPRSLE